MIWKYFSSWPQVKGLMSSGWRSIEWHEVYGSNKRQFQGRETQKWIHQSTWGFGSIQIISGLKFCPKIASVHQWYTRDRNFFGEKRMFSAFGLWFWPPNMTEYGRRSNFRFFFLNGLFFCFDALLNPCKMIQLMMICSSQLKGICKNMNLQKHCRLRI